MTQQLPLGLEDVAPTPRRRQRRAFHVRSHVRVEEQQAGEAAARRGDARVLDYFRANPGRRFAPSDVHQYLAEFCGTGGDDIAPRAPLLTSVRRSISNLTARGLLVHYPADRRPGPHGARESTWGLALESRPEVRHG